jgi:hypothetical protein
MALQEPIKFGRDFGIDTSDIPAEMGYFLVFPYPEKAQQ